jgi:2-dehydro-3-deoxyphosphogluconate aldolase/(4S)-4-hydroxy-2-oxoglutarate aldolase
MLTETPLRKLLSGVPAIPVMTVREVQESTEIAKALHAGGLTVFEITLRTPQAWAAVEALRKELPDACVGIGTVMREEQLRQAHESGVDFAVSAALHLPLVEAAQKLGLPYLPGTETASEVFAAREAGCTTLKLFPAVASMGMDRLKNFAPVFPDVDFVPTGGINSDNFRAYLTIPNVLTVGGGWMMPKQVVADKSWRTLEGVARDLVARTAELT